MKWQADTHTSARTYMIVRRSLLRMYANKTIKKYLEDLSAKKPVPGGGSASALAAALGASLISMVVNFTLGKPKYLKYQKDLKKILAQSDKLRREFLRLTDEDILAYSSKDIKKATQVPYKIAVLCFTGIKLCPELADKGNVNLVSDVAVAAVLLEAAFSAAYYNVLINLAKLDKKSAVKFKNDLDKKMKSVKKFRIGTEKRVGKIIRR